MKICIPTINNKGLQSQVSPHFGRASTYTIYDTKTQEAEIIQNTSDHVGGSCLPAKLFEEKDITIMLCQAIGQGALTQISKQNITVYIGATGTVQEAIDSFQSKQLQVATINTVCSNHETHNCNCSYE